MVQLAPLIPLEEYLGTQRIIISHLQDSAPLQVSHGSSIQRTVSMHHTGFHGLYDGVLARIIILTRGLLEMEARWRVWQHLNYGILGTLLRLRFGSPF